MKNLRAYIDLSMAMAIVGSSVVVGKLMVASFPVFLASGLRFAIGSAILLPLAMRRGGVLSSATPKDRLFLFLQAFTGVFLFTVLLLYGLKLTGAASAGIITSTTPAVVGLISFVFLREHLSLNKGAGIALTVLGIAAVNMVGIEPGADGGAVSLLGNLLVFGAVIGEALFTIFRKVTSREVSFLTTATLMSVLGFFMFLPFAVYEAIGFDFSAVSAGEWGYILYYGIVVTVVAYILWFRGVADVPASTAAVFTGVMPVSSVLLSYVVLGEPFSWTHVAGVLCVLVGIGFIAGTPVTTRLNSSAA
jgi:drug/metabolite transporter (DMT)-like permease